MARRARRYPSDDPVKSGLATGVDQACRKAPTPTAFAGRQKTIATLEPRRRAPQRKWLRNILRGNLRNRNRLHLT